MNKIKAFGINDNEDKYVGIFENKKGNECWTDEEFTENDMVDFYKNYVATKKMYDVVKYGSVNLLSLVMDKCLSEDDIRNLLDEIEEEDDTCYSFYDERQHSFVAICGKTLYKETYDNNEDFYFEDPTKAMYQRYELIEALKEYILDLEEIIF